MLQITAGTRKGLVLKAPDRGEVRPTSERVRGAIFNMLARWGLEDRRVLDLFAGTGALGLEALSRGAAWVDFVEKDRRVHAVLRENIRTAGFQDRCQARLMDAVRALETLDGPYDLVLMDPPYANEIVPAAMATLARRDILTPDAVVVVEHGRQTPVAERFGRLRMTDHREYGDTALTLFGVGEDRSNDLRTVPGVL